MVKSYGVGWGGVVVVAHVIIVSPLIFDWFGFGFGSRRTGLGTRA